MYVEDLKRGTNAAEKGGRPKDIFEMGSIIDGKLIPERYQGVMALTDFEKRIFGILRSAPGLSGDAGASV